MDKSYTCCGFRVSEVNEKLELYHVKVERQQSSQIHTSGGITEGRLFISECEVFTNSSGLTCSTCSEVKTDHKKRKEKQGKDSVHRKRQVSLISLLSSQSFTRIEDRCCNASFTLPMCSNT